MPMPWKNFIFRTCQFYAHAVIDFHIPQFQFYAYPVIEFHI